MLATTHRVAGELNVTTCEYFGPRDADTATDEAIGTLGLVDNNYQPKTSFGTYRDIITGRE